MRLFRLLLLIPVVCALGCGGFPGCGVCVDHERIRLEQERRFLQWKLASELHKRRLRREIDDLRRDLEALKAPKPLFPTVR